MDQRDIRVSDADRQAAADRLRGAHDEGRLTLAEYDERVASAYAAVTYGDLAELFVDLPDQPTTPSRSPAPSTAAVAPQPEKRKVAAAPGVFASLPGSLRAAWSVWLTVVSINVVIWLLVSIGNGTPDYFWPMWVAGPWGAVLLASSAATLAARRGRQLDKPSGRREIVE